MANSAFYAGFGALLSAAVSAAGGYALGRFAFRGREAVFKMILAGVLVPSIVLAVPQYLLLSKMGMADSYWSMLLPSILSPYGVYLVRIYAAASVPTELMEAARMDGASEWRIFSRIAVPMMMPGLITVFLFQFVGIWNNFLLPYVMLADDEQVPDHPRPLHAARPGRLAARPLHPGHHRVSAGDPAADRALPGDPAVLVPGPAERLGQGLSAQPVQNARPRTRTMTTSANGRRRPPTIHDVAREAGVSRGTVSRFLNGGHYVSPAARRAVEAAIRKTGYVVNRHARSLSTGRSDSVAFLLTEPQEKFFEDPNFNVLLRGCTERLAAARHPAAADAGGQRRRPAPADPLHHLGPRRRRAAGLQPQRRPGGRRTARRRASRWWPAASRWASAPR